MKALKKRTFAVFLLVCSVVFSVLYGGYRSLKEVVNTVDDVFYYGDYNGGSIEEYLQARAALAINLTTVAKRYMPENAPEIANVLAARQKLLNAYTVADKSVANRELTAATNMLYYVLSQINMSEVDSIYKEKIHLDFISYNTNIANDPYNRYVARADKEFDKFPGRIIAKFTGIKKAQYFSNEN